MHNLEAEQAIVGTILAYNEAILRVGDLSAEHFFFQQNADIFALVRKYTNDRKPCNIITAKHELPHVEPQYLAALVNASDSVVSVQSYAKIVQDLSLKRQLLEACNQCLSLPVESTPEQLMGILSQAVTNATQLDKSAKTAKQVAYEILEKVMNGDKPTLTGLRMLDEAMGGGMYPSMAYGIPARKKMGKTTLAGTISYNLAEQKVKHLFICAEMGSVQIHMRNLARRMGIYPSAFRLGNKRPMGFETELAHQASIHEEYTIYYDAPGITFEKLQQVVSAAVLKGCKGFILDYWQLVKCPHNKNKTEHLDEVAQWIHEACQKYNVWAIVLGQVNRDGTVRGGDGMQLAFDQVYQLQAIGENADDASEPGRWLEMLDTRYTSWANIGSKDCAGLIMNEKGPFFEEV